MRSTTPPPESVPPSSKPVLASTLPPPKGLTLPDFVRTPPLSFGAAIALARFGEPQAPKTAARVDIDTSWIPEIVEGK